MSEMKTVRVESIKGGNYFCRDEDGKLYKVPANGFPSQNKAHSEIDVIVVGPNGHGQILAELPQEDTEGFEYSSDRSESIDWDGSDQDIESVGSTKDISKEGDRNGSMNDLLL